LLARASLLSGSRVLLRPFVQRTIFRDLRCSTNNFWLKVWTRSFALPSTTLLSCDSGHCRSTLARSGCSLMAMALSREEWARSSVRTIWVLGLDRGDTPCWRRTVKLRRCLPKKDCKMTPWKTPLSAQMPTRCWRICAEKRREASSAQLAHFLVSRKSSQSRDRTESHVVFSSAEFD